MGCEMGRDNTPSVPFVRGAFSFVEILIVVVIGAIVAMIVVPRVFGVSDYARASALASDLDTARRLISLYKLQHGGRSPHFNEFGQKDENNFIARMTSRTDEDGKLDPNGTCGPYLTEWPANPYCADAIARQILFGKTADTPLDGTAGWYYSKLTLQLHINAPTDISKMHEVLKKAEPFN